MRVDAIIPARNAATLLPGCLDAVLAQTVRPGQVLVAVGPSGDGTREVAAAWSERDERVVVVDNPAGDRASALNAAIERLDPDVGAVAMVDAQSRLAADYLERSLAVLEATGAAVVGGPMRPSGEGILAEAIAAALSSRAGVGNSSFHFEGRARDVESVYLGVYRRSVLDAVGPYDPRLLRTEDDDMNARIRAAGGVIRLDPAIVSTYLGRRTIGALYRQYYGYGHSKVALAAVRPDAIRARHLVPAALVAGLVSTAGLSVVGPRPAFPLAAGAYAAGLVAAGLATTTRRLAVRLAVPAALAAMHLGYGIGSWHAILTGRWRRP